MTAALPLSSLKCRKFNSLICKFIWNVTVRCFLSLVLKKPEMTLSWINPNNYLHLSTDENMNQWLLKKITKKFLSSLMKINSWILGTFPVDQQVLIHSRKHTKHQKQKDFSPTTGSINLTKYKTQNFLRMTRSTVKSVVVHCWSRIQGICQFSQKWKDR